MGARTDFTSRTRRRQRYSHRRRRRGRRRLRRRPSGLSATKGADPLLLLLLLLQALLRVALRDEAEEVVFVWEGRLGAPGVGHLHLLRGVLSARCSFMGRSVRWRLCARL